MKNTYSFTQSDVSAITTALTVLPAYEFFASDIAEAALAVAASADSKLIKQEPLTKRECVLIALSIDNAYKALRNEIDLDSEYIARLRPYLFTYNKLQPIFASFLDN